MQIDSQTYRAEPKNYGRAAFMVGAVGLVVSVVGYFVDRQQFFHSYLTAFSFWTTLSLGGLFYTMLHHLTGAKWSVVLRRFFENMMMNLPLMGIFIVPILLFGMHHLYEWTHAEVVAKDLLLQKKSAYLNMPFFFLRTLVYFGVWFLVSRSLYRNSLKQDQGDPLAQAKMHKVSAPGMILFALTITFSAIDWLMSLSPHWFSTMFGVYLFASSIQAGIAFITLLVLGLQRAGGLRQEITVEHYHDLGKLMFAFTVFWTYIAFCQYMLIWYSNMPEETFWFANRWQGTWRYVSLLIVLGHFVVPFLFLLGRAAKRNALSLGMIAVWIVLMHLVDQYWIVHPNHQPMGPQLSWMDAATWLGIGGVYMGCWLRRFFSAAVVPVQDPDLATSIQFENA